MDTWPIKTRMFSEYGNEVVECQEFYHPELCKSPDQRARPGSPKDALKQPVLYSIRAILPGFLSNSFSTAPLQICTNSNANVSVG